MSALTPNANVQSPVARILFFLRKVIEPHYSIKDAGQKRRVQLLNGLSLTFAIILLLGLATGARILAAISYLLPAMTLAFAIGKTRYPRIGVTIFTVSALLSGYVILYQGASNNYLYAMLTFTPVALVLAHALVSHRSFALLAFATTAVTFASPLYSRTMALPNDVLRAGGVFAILSLALYGVSSNRARVEAAYQQEVLAADERLQAARAEQEQRAAEQRLQAEAAGRQLQQKNKQIQTFAELSEDIAANASKPLPELLMYATHSISEKMDYYHVGIFLLDKDRQYAELRAANSEGGRRMLERRHQLQVGGAGIVGYVAQSGYLRVALSTGTDAVFFNNPDLPATQSEMALPLKHKNQVVGVLDIQSERPNAFSEEETNIFIALANQIGALIGASESIQIINRETQASTQELLSQKVRGGYMYQPDGAIVSAEAIDSPVLSKALQKGEVISAPASSKDGKPVLVAPVKIRETVVGYIYIEAEDRNRKWSEDETALAQAVSERAALALENARLFEEAERRAEQEQTMAKITERIGASLSFEQILQTTVQEIGRTLGAKRAFIEVSAPSGETVDEESQSHD
ncbi:MAG: hypothetical protein Fur002_08920 [Anaerolineales bacterium]